MSLPLFEGPRLKVKRGLEHVASLEIAIFALKADVPPTMHSKDSGSQVLFKANRDLTPPPEFGLILGDAIHNFRAALDLLACDLARAFGQSPKGVRFPFWNDDEDERDVQQMIKRSNLARAGEHIVNFVRETVRPCPTGNPHLRALHDLDITDKHALIVPITHQNVIKYGNIILRGSHNEYDMVDLRPKHMRAGPPTVDYEIVLDGGQPLAFSELVSTLKGIAADVKGIIDALASLTTGKQADP